MPIDVGVYFGAAHVVAPTARADTQTTEPVLQLFVTEVSDCDPFSHIHGYLQWFHCSSLGVCCLGGQG